KQQQILRLRKISSSRKTLSSPTSRSDVSNVSSGATARRYTTAGIRYGGPRNARLNSLALSSSHNWSPITGGFSSDKNALNVTPDDASSNTECGSPSRRPSQKKKSWPP